jgi:hypothetical protein
MAFSATTGPEPAGMPDRYPPDPSAEPFFVDRWIRPAIMQVNTADSVSRTPMVGYRPPAKT